MTKRNKIKLTYYIVILLAANFARISYSMTQYAERIIKPPPVESPATTAREEIVTGVCDFGGCPVATTAATTTLPPTTEVVNDSLTTVKPTEESTHSSDTYTLMYEDVAENATSELMADGRNNGYIGTFNINGYTAEEGFPEGSATASGYGVRQGYCAMNAEQRRLLGISYGDQIYVEGLGTYTVMDSGCDWGVVDIWCWSNAEAYSITGNRCVYYG